MALQDIQDKILAEAQAQAAQITADAEKAAASKIAAAQKQIKAERQKAEADFARERANSLTQYKQLLEMESEQKALAFKRECLDKVLLLAAKKLDKSKLPLEFDGAKITADGETVPLTISELAGRLWQ